MEATPSPTRKHLKTLSLSSPSPRRSGSLGRSADSPHSAAAASSPAQALRLSLRGQQSVNEGGIIPDAPWSAPIQPQASGEATQDDRHVAESVPNTPPKNNPFQHGRTPSDRKSLHRLSLGSDVSSASSGGGLRSSWGSSRGSLDFDTQNATDLAALKKARRTSSISYTRSDTVTPTFSSPTPSPVASRALTGLEPNNSASPLTPAYPSPLSSSLSSVPEHQTTPNSPSLSQTSSSATPSKMSSGATLVEQHADLLSFIATKERKCLDLREELKRHEDDLKGLKKKWESIVARDQQASSTSLQPGSSSHTSGGRSPRSPASPNMQSSSSLDSQTSRQFPHSIEDAPLTMGVGDVTAARKWMGSWMKSGVAGVSGIIEGMSEARSSSDLGTVREEEEDVESDAKRSSQASSNASTTATSVSGAETTSKPDENNNTLLVKIDEDDSEQQPTNTRVRQQQQQQSSSERDFKGLLDKQNRRSVFDMGHNINWGDTFKRGSKAAMGFVESFEKTLVEGMMLPEGSNGGQVSSTLAGDLMYDPTASASLAPASPTPSGSRSKTPSPRHSPSLRKSPAPTFNWDAALDGSSGDISAEPLKAVQPDVAPRTIASQRISDARQNHARRQSMPPGSMTASKPPISKESDTTEETDGWGW